jgi:uncharacterized ubiquitin-like protein YukD
MASKLYGAAYCFAYKNIDLKLPTLRNMRKTYQKLGNMKNVNLVEKEIQRIEVLNDRENDTNIIPIKKAG